MDQKALAYMGFKLNRNSTHTARTIMVSELNLLFEYIVDHNATTDDYVEAMVHDNCLYKRSMSNRKITAKHLLELYTLDRSVPIFRALRYLWYEDEASRPLLALLCATTRDSILHDTAQHFWDLSLSTVITREDTERWVNAMETGRFSEVTLRSTAKNLNSSWTQSGHLVGRVQKTRIKPDPNTGATVFALFLGYLSGFRGMQLFQSEYVKILDCSEHEAVNLAQEAAQKGLLTFKKLGDVVEVGFPNILTSQDKELLV
jgi:hypothetical protein